jgi:type II secretion system protein N
MTRWVGGVFYLLWGLLCFLVFFHFFFPYEVMGRRILYTLEQKTGLVSRPSARRARLLGIRWARVDLMLPQQKNLPPVEIRDWVIELRPLALLVGRLSVSSHGSVMDGAFQIRLVSRRGGQQGFMEWRSVRLDQFPLFLMEGDASFTGMTSGTVQWEVSEQILNGKASFEIRNGKIQDIVLAGFSVPVLDLGEAKGRMNWKEGRLNLEEINVAGEDVNARLTGNVLMKAPVIKSQLACRVEVRLAPRLLDRYPVVGALYKGREDQAKPLIMTIRGTVKVPEISFTP